MNNYELKVFMSSLPSPWPVKQSDMPCGAQGPEHSHDITTIQQLPAGHRTHHDTPTGFRSQWWKCECHATHATHATWKSKLQKSTRKRSNPVSEYKIRLYVTLSQPQDNCMSEPLSQGTKKVKQHIKTFFIHTCLTTCPNKIQTA